MNRPLLIINNKRYCIENPLLIIKTFCVLDPSYKKYDSIKLGDKTWLEEAIGLSNQGMRARINKKKEKRDIIKKQLEIDRKIKKLKISEDKNLLDKNNEKIEKLRELFKIFENIKGVKNAKITKILHKKFPNLIPIVDSIVAKVYCKKNKSIDDLIDIIEKIKKDYKKNINFLENLKFDLKKENINLSLLRIFDIILWMKGQDSEQKILGKGL